MFSFTIIIWDFFNNIVLFFFYDFLWEVFSLFEGENIDMKIFKGWVRSYEGGKYKVRWGVRGESDYFRLLKINDNGNIYWILVV